jgi:hypothetical protein
VKVVPELLRDNLQFRRFFAGQAISLVGDQITLIALPLVAVLALDATPARWATWSPPRSCPTCSSRCTPAPGSTAAVTGGR